MYNILICDDEKDIVAALEIYLKAEGYNTFCAYNGYEAIQVINSEEIHLALLDIMMPQCDGITAMAKIRENSNLPIILLTAKGEDTDKILGLNVGADDYITKPVSMKVLCSRVGAICKRIESGERIVFPKSSRLVEERHAFISDGMEVPLAVKEFEILRLLLSEPRIFTREEIFDAVWGAEVVVGSRTLDVHIRHLRSKIGEEYIQTHKGIGFSYKN